MKGRLQRLVGRYLSSYALLDDQTSFSETLFGCYDFFDVAPVDLVVI